MTETVDRLRSAIADRYALERELGSGGMATVYLAHDLRHDRDVALKVLHPDLGAALGGDRFLSEIKTTAKLHHPHILPLLDSGAADGLLYYVMPYVTGETLRARLERERQLPVDDAVRIAREVADALAHAHALGIIHRDIKPENILLQGGHALVADFGIALAVQQAKGKRMTQTGLSLGTPQYMSPEQAMGERTVDARTDIYALGAVTYEMLTGEPPYTGATVQAVVAKLMAERPTAPTTIRETVPPGVEAAILKALAKLPADRFTTAEKFAEALARPDVMPAVSGPNVVGRPGARRIVGRRTVVIGVAVSAAIIAAATALGYALGRRSAGTDVAWSGFTQLTDASGVETSPSLSPDGQSFAFASNARGGWDIYVQRVGGRNPVLVAGDTTVDELWPAYSPDGREIAYNLRGGQGIFIVGSTGESARRLTTFGSNPAWSPDGKRLAFGSEEVNTAYNVNNTGTLWTVNASGGEPKRLDPTGRGLYQPAWSPSGAQIAFWASIGGQRDLETIPAAGGPRVRLTNDVAVDWAPVWSPDGKYLYFASDRGGTMGIWRIPMDEASGKATGAPTPVASGADVEMDLPHLSSDGMAMVFRSRIESANPAAITFDPTTDHIGAVTLLQHRTGLLVPTDVSPDGKWLALINAPDRRQDIFVMRPDGSELRRLTDDDARDWAPRFTPDGEAITFFSNASGKFDGWSIRLDGSGRTRLTDFKAGVNFTVFAPDAKRLMTTGTDTGAFVGQGPWPLTEKSATPLPMKVEGGTLKPTYWSRDGRWLSGLVVAPTGEPDGQGIYDVAAKRAWRLSKDSRSYDVAWLPGGQRVAYFTTRGMLVVQDIVSLERHEATGTLPYAPDLLGSVVASSDGRTLYYGATQLQSNIWLARRSSPGASKQ